MKSLENQQKKVTAAINKVAQEMLDKGSATMQFSGSVDIIGRVRICNGGIVFADVKVEHLQQVDIKKGGCHGQR